MCIYKLILIAGFYFNPCHIVALQPEHNQCVVVYAGGYRTLDMPCDQVANKLKGN